MIKQGTRIAICGKIRSGKDTAGQYICEKYGHKRFGFGDGLWEICYRLFPEQFIDSDENPVKPRALLQGVGESLRTFSRDVWVNDCFRRINEPIYFKDVNEPFLPPEKVVITDLRQPAEYERCRAENFLIIRITAPEALRIQRAITASDTFNFRDLTHPTESHIDSFAVDYEIENSATPADLYAQIDAIMGELKLT